MGDVGGPAAGGAGGGGSGGGCGGPGGVFGDQQVFVVSPAARGIAKHLVSGVEGLGAGDGFGTATIGVGMMAAGEFTIRLPDVGLAAPAIEAEGFVMIGQVVTDGHRVNVGAGRF